MFWLAWMSLAATDLFKAIVLFIAFGLLMAVGLGEAASARYRLAEAAIGAGLTGALLLSTLARISSPGETKRPDHDGDSGEKS